MVRLSNNDSQNLALPQATNAASRVASRQAQAPFRGEAVAARSRVNSAKHTTSATEATQNTRANELGGAVTQSPSVTVSAQRAELEDSIAENLEFSKSMKQYYEGKIDSLTAQGEISSDYGRAMLANHRQELSLYQSATDFWSAERKTSYQYTEESLPQAMQLYDQIKSLQSAYDPSGTSLFQISDKVQELYGVKQEANPFGENASVNPAEQQSIMLLRLSAAKGSNADTQNQVDKWLAYDGADQDSATTALTAAKDQASFTKTSISIWENRFNFWNEVSEQAHFQEDAENLDKMEELSTRMEELENILGDWLGKTDDTGTARSKAAETLSLIGELEVEIRRLFI